MGVRLSSAIPERMYMYDSHKAPLHMATRVRWFCCCNHLFCQSLSPDSETCVQHSVLLRVLNHISLEPTQDSEQAPMGCR